MKQILGLVAVIGLTLTAVMGCATRNESVEALASEAEASEAASLKKDCARIYYEMLSAIAEISSGDTGEEWVDKFIAGFARSWPQLNDPDLKSIFRELAESWEGEIGELPDEPAAIAYNTICSGRTYF